MCARASFSALFLFSLSVNLWAQSLTPVTQDRSLWANSFDWNCADPGTRSDQRSAADYTRFNEVLVSQHFQGYGRASQDSQILPSEVLGVGGALGSGSGVDNGGGGTSRFDLTFQLAADTPFTLSGTLTADSFFVGGIAVAEVSLDAVFSDSLNGGVMQSRPFTTSGILAAGTHRLRLEARASSPAGMGHAQAGFDFQFLLVPEPTSACGFALLTMACLGKLRRSRR